MGNSKSNAKNI